MSINQGERQAFFRAISGTTTDYNGDFLAAAATQSFTGEFNGVFIQWLQDRTGSSSTNLDGLKQEFAELAGAHNWESTGGVPIILPSCDLWLDASDLSTITKDGSDLVSQWDDKSGNNIDATQGTGALQALFASNQINGKPALKFEGDAGHEYFDLPSIQIYTNCAIFVVLQADNEVTGTGERMGFLASLANDFNNNISVFEADSRCYMEEDDGSAFFGDNIGSAITSPTLYNFNYNSGGTSTYRINRSAFGTNMALNSTLKIGVVGRGFNGGLRGWKGLIGEILIYNRDLSSAETTVVENYLSNKWGTP